MTTLRTFIAIDLDEELRASLQHLQDRLRDQVSPRGIPTPFRGGIPTPFRGCVRWVRPEGIHLTLKFLGDTPTAKVDEVKAALTQAAAEVAPFAFSVGGLGCFPNTQRPRVIWVGLQEPTGTLSRLQKAVEAHVAPLGYPSEKRPFHPHLTLGRVQGHASRSEVREIGELILATEVGTLDEMTVAAVSYIKSDLRPSGAVYTTLFEAGLGRG